MAQLEEAKNAPALSRQPEGASEVSHRAVDHRLSDLESDREAIEHRLVVLERSEGVSNELRRLREQLKESNELALQRDTREAKRSESEGRRAKREWMAQVGLGISSLFTVLILIFHGVQLKFHGVQLKKDVDQAEEGRRMVRHFEWLELIYAEECPPDRACEPLAHRRLRQEAVVNLAILAQQQREDLDLSRADLSGLDFSGLDFSSAILESVDFSSANLTNANFTGARLVNAKLDEATMERAKLYGASLERSFATLQLLDVARAYVSLASTLQGACGDSETLLPKGFEALRPSGWLDRPVRHDDLPDAGCPNIVEPSP